MVGSSVTLKCHLLRSDTTITQVSWNFCNQVYIAFQISDTEGIVLQDFSERVTLAKDYGITISQLNRNDSGNYCCIYNTFPHGSFTGKIFLQVLSKDPRTQDYYVWVGSGLGILLVVAAVGAGGFYYKKKTSKIFYSNSGPKTSGANPPNMASPALMTSSDETSEYFNVVLYHM
ncbi:T-cell immunoreceptor with Ig and ITIM domains [Leptodactylus fuscus]